MNLSKQPVELKLLHFKKLWTAKISSYLLTTMKHYQAHVHIEVVLTVMSTCSYDLY